MNTTESIIAELQSELDEHIGAGRHVASSHCRQQIIAHQTLARLRAEYEAHPSDGLASQIRFWARKTDRDVDPAGPKRRGGRKPAPEPEPALDDQAQE